MIMDMDIPLAKTGGNRVHILDVAKALTKRIAESRFQVYVHFLAWSENNKSNDK